MASLVRQDVEQFIVTLRSQRVILDTDLARLYGVATKVLNQAVKRNKKRFPEAFLFQLTLQEKENLNKTMRSQFVTASQKRNLRYLPYAFTEHGALMAANVLNSPRAITMSVEIVLTFVRLRRLALSVAELSQKLEVLEKKYEKHDHQFKLAFDAIRQLMTPPEPSRRKIGFSKD